MADLVDRAIDGAETPAGTDTGFARDLTVMVRAFALEPRHASALWERITTAAPAPGAEQSGFTWPLSQGRRTVLTAALAVVAAFVVVAAALLSAGGSVDAHDIVAKVELGSVDPSAIGLTRYSGSLRFSSWLTADGTRGNVPIVIDERIFFEAPNRMRLESTPAQTSSAPVSIVVGDGTGVWLLTPSTRTAFRMDAGPGGTLASLAGSDVQAVLANASRDYAVRGEGNEVVAGRSADRVGLTPLSSSGSAGRVGKMSLSIDHQYSVVLAGRVIDPAGQLLYEWTFSRIDFPPSLDGSLFALPAGTTVVSAVDRTPPAAVGTDARWSELARALPFAIFRPTFRSDTLEPGFPSQDQNRLVVTYRSLTNLGAAIVIEAASAPGPEPGETVALPGGGVATYARDGDRQRMVVRRDGTRIEVQAPLELSRDELTKIVGSLVAVPR